MGMSILGRGYSLYKIIGGTFRKRIRRARCESSFDSVWDERGEWREVRRSFRRDGV